MKKLIHSFISSILFFSCQTDKNEMGIFKNKISEKEYKIIELSTLHFNNYLKICYPNLSYDDSYKQFVKDFIKDDIKKGVFTTEIDKKYNNNILNETDIFIKIEDVNKAYENPFKGKDVIFDEFYPNLYVLNYKSSFFKIIEENASSNLKKYLVELKKNKEYYSDYFTNYFLLNINELDYKNSSTKFVIIFNFYYNISINNYNMSKYENEQLKNFSR